MDGSRVPVVDGASRYTTSIAGAGGGTSVADRSFSFLESSAPEEASGTDVKKSAEPPRGEVLSRGVCIGAFVSIGIDDGMGVLSADFEPVAAYLDVAPLFREISDLIEAKRAIPERLRLEQDALGLELRTRNGDLIPTDWVTIYDYRRRRRSLSRRQAER
jgi:hypothetical protein